RAERPAARTAQRVRARAQAVAHAHTLVEDEALALPAALAFGHLLQVLQDAAFEVVDLLEALHAQQGRGLLAADATRAEHGHARFGGALQGWLARQPAGQIGEGADAWIDRAVEAA